MTKRTIENLIDTEILKQLDMYYYIPSTAVPNLFDTDNNDDLEEIFDIISNSKRYNYILLQNGDAYIFSKSHKNSVVELFNDIPINLDDQVWGTYVYKGNESMTLRELYTEVML